MQSINCIGMICPMPILKVRLKLNSLKKGDQLEILADCPGFTRDFELFCYQADLKLLEMYRESNHIRYIVELIK